MSDIIDYIDEVGAVVDALAREGFKSVLIGGMALVVLGSRRVTKDFDFLISEKARAHKQLVKILYAKDLELVSRINNRGEVTTTIDNPQVAFSRLQIDAPASAYFYNRKTGLRIDFLFDYPESVEPIFSNARKMTLRSHRFYIASKDDLIRLKKTAVKNRSVTADVQDLEFLSQLDK